MFFHGKNTAFKIDNSAGVLADISAYLNDVGFPRPVKTVDTTTFGASADTFIPGLPGATISISGLWDAALDLILSAVLGQAAPLSFEYGPAGSTVANIKYTGECIMTSYDVKGPIGGAVTFSAAYQVTGLVTRGTY